ncbi:hypothetical protein L211DRAFT_832432 [Terfezia boudieri ATCC MYA-4762]|uniref:BTB domain-containing protein n=1 Tax=Terfezia boudieri ATCC MYA-4762 TaxID=1051890 RepID=A0A3N4M3I2_9PEZI|nr:hypothetical protein L211DRAFT_832432 [Terfezia boudieri ATCC MYA-4762]
MPPTRQNGSRRFRTRPRSKGAETTSCSTATKATKADLFDSKLFKIILTDPNESLPIIIESDPELEEPITTGTAHDSGTVFRIHKRLLMSLSPELAKHSNNLMKRGLSGEVALDGVDTSTMQWFLQWAYRGKCKLYVLPVSISIWAWLRVSARSYSRWICTWLIA